MNSVRSKESKIQVNVLNGFSPLTLWKLFSIFNHIPKFTALYDKAIYKLWINSHSLLRVPERVSHPLPWCFQAVGTPFRPDTLPANDVRRHNEHVRWTIYDNNHDNTWRILHKLVAGIWTRYGTCHSMKITRCPCPTTIHRLSTNDMWSVCVGKSSPREALIVSFAHTPCRSIRMTALCTIHIH